MAELPYVDSAAHYNSSTAAGKWTSINGGSGATMGISNTGGRSGLNGYLTSGAGAAAFITLIGNYSSLYVGVAYLTTTFGTTNPPIQIGSNGASGTPKVSLIPQADGTLVVQAAQTSGATNTSARFGVNGRPCSTNVWYYFEISGVCNNSVLTATARVNGLAAGNATLAANFAGNNFFRQVTFGQSGGGTPTNMCDFYISQNGFYGDVVIGLIKPASPGFYTQFVSSNNAVPNWQVETQIPPNNNNQNISAANANTNDSYVMQTIPTSAIVYAVQGLHWSAKDLPGICTYKTLLRSNNNDQLGTQFAPSANSFAFTRDSFELSPFSNNNWTASEVNNMQFGLTRVT